MRPHPRVALRPPLPFRQPDALHHVQRYLWANGRAASEEPLFSRAGGGAPLTADYARSLLLRTCASRTWWTPTACSTFRCTLRA